MSRIRRKPKPGTHPGALVVDEFGPDIRVHLIGYGPRELEEREVESVQEIEDFLARFPVTWVNIDGLGDGALLQEIGDLFGMHPLALEDVVNVPQRAKVEVYGDDLFVIAHMVSERDGVPATEQMSLYLTERCAITFQERPGDCLEPVRLRLRSGTRRRLREWGADYLTYALLDAVIDHYFPVLEAFQHRLERLEDELRAEVDDPYERIRAAREEVRALRGAIRPAGEMTRLLAVGDLPHIGGETPTFLRDCHDHVLEAIDQLEGCREIASNLMDVHLSAESHRANETMKVLTLVATIFMPLSFLAGIYGMNFDPSLPGNMPELGMPYGYLVLLGVMAAVAVVMLLFFKKKDWF